jgi:hypothetical protein
LPYGVSGIGFLKHCVNHSVQGLLLYGMFRPVTGWNGLERTQKFALIHFTGKRLRLQPLQSQGDRVFKMNVLANCLADVFDTKRV